MLIAGVKGEVVLLGLSRENVNRLIAGKPIRVNKESHPEAAPVLPEPSIVIFFGETEAEMANELHRLGLVDPDALVRAHGGE